MASVRAGVVTELDVQTPGDSDGSSLLGLWDTDAGSFWAFVWFVAAVIVLFVIL